MVKERIAGLLGPEFQTRLGLRQGCVLAPILFNIYLDAVMRKMKNGPGILIDIVDRKSLSMPNMFRIKAGSTCTISEIRFADDTALIEKDPLLLQNSITNLHESGEQYGLSISVKKTKVMFVNMPSSCFAGKITLGNASIETVSKFVYLGCEIRDDGTDTGEIQRRIGMCWSSFVCLRAVLWKRREISIQTKMKLVNALILCRLLYGSETWTITARDLQRLEAFQTQCLRRMLRISWMSKVTNEEVREKCLQVTLEARLRQRRLGWLGHVQRMHWSRYPRMTLGEGCHKVADAQEARKKNG